MAGKEKKGLIAEFKEFISRGSVMDLAIGVIIGAAFGKIVSSLVNDIVMPIIGIVLGKVDFNDLMWVISRNAEGEVASALRYGTFIQVIIEFLIIAFVVFMLMKAVNTVKKKAEAAKKKSEEEVVAEPEPEPAPPEPTKEEVLLTEIRDLLKK